jgi:hypothetical protein
MNFKYKLPDFWIKQIAGMESFANGGTQVTIQTNDGSLYEQVLISNSVWIVAMRGENELPFNMEAIARIYQSEDDKNPKCRGNWEFWDDWEENKTPDYDTP